MNIQTRIEYAYLPLSTGVADRPVARSVSLAVDADVLSNSILGFVALQALMINGYKFSARSHDRADVGRGRIPPSFQRTFLILRRMQYESFIKESQGPAPLKKQPLRCLTTFQKAQRLPLVRQPAIGRRWTQLTRLTTPRRATGLGPTKP